MEWPNRLHRSSVPRAAKCVSSAKRSRGRDMRLMVVTVGPRVDIVRRRHDAGSKRQLLAHGPGLQREGFVLRLAPAERTHKELLSACRMPLALDASSWMCSMR